MPGECRVGVLGGRTLDFSVVDSQVTLPGSIVPEDHAAEPWKVHGVDPFDYFDVPLRGQLLALNVRRSSQVTEFTNALLVYER